MLTTIVNLALPVGDPNRVINIQGYQAESYSETPSQPNFEPFDIGGRSSPIAYYNGGSARTISFSMVFHRDMVAPQTSAVYGGMPAGIEADNSQYAGLYLGSKTAPTTKELTEKFVQDYLKYYNDVRYENGMVSRQLELDDLSFMGRTLKPNQTATKFSDGAIVIVTYNDNGEIETTEAINSRAYFDYQGALQQQNIKAEADATARFHIFLNKLRALNYPVYNSNGIIPPKVYLKIGGDSNNGLGGLRLKGYCTTNINYDGIVKYNSLISTTVDFTFTEVVDIAWSAPEVINGMQRYVKWMDPTIR